MSTPETAQEHTESSIGEKMSRKEKKALKQAIQELAHHNSVTPEQYLLARLQFKIQDYSSKGKLYRLSYGTMACLTVGFSAIVPVLINVADPKETALLATVLSLAVSILVGIEGVLHLREHWKNYDWAKVVLRREKFNYQTQSGDYTPEKLKEKERTAFQVLVERVEDAMLEERRQTIEMRTAVASNPKENGK